MPKNLPITIVFDDVGFTTVDSDGTGAPIPFEVYERLLELAVKHKVRLPVAVTAKYFDVENISNLNSVNPDAERIIEFLKHNNEYLPVWNHGLTHQFGEEFTEFYSYKYSYARVIEEQHEHFQFSTRILKNLGFNSDYFVPPAHAWEPGITDRIAAEYGIKTIAIREFEKKSIREWMLNPFSPYLKEWSGSTHLRVLYRLGLGIPYNQLRLFSADLSKCKTFISPSNPVQKIMVHRTFRTLNSPHHFFAHIQNLIEPESTQVFSSIIEHIKMSKVLNTGND